MIGKQMKLLQMELGRTLGLKFLTLRKKSAVEFLNITSCQYPLFLHLL